MITLDEMLKDIAAVSSLYGQVGLAPFPHPNEVGYWRGSTEWTFSITPFPNRTGTFQFIRLSGPCFRNDAVGLPA